MSNDAPQFESLDACVEHWMKHWTVPGLVVGILKDGHTEGYGYGLSSLRTGYPVTPDMLFRVASLSKTFTATLVMTLVDEGLLDLDEPIVRYLPDLELYDSEAQDTITLRHLLSHSSGLLGDFFVDFGLGADALDTAIRHFPELRQLTRPGELWAYCNSGFHLTGAVVQRVLATPFETAMRERIFEPLGMKQTGFFAHEAIVWPVAIGHNQTEPGGDEHQLAPQYYPRNRNPAGGVISSAPDLLRFAAMHLQEGDLDGRRVLTAQSARSMQEPVIRSGAWAGEWGVGWDIRDFNGTRVIGHSGSINGYQSRLTLVPDQGFALVVLTNSGRGSAAYRPIESWILQHYCGLRDTAPEVVALPESTLSHFAGFYRQQLAEIRVKVQGQGLRLETRAPHPVSGEWVDYPPNQLLPIGENRFLVTDGESAGERVEFIMGETETPRFVRVHGRLADRVEG